MCLTCRILNPLSDYAAELLGVEKRKYLVYGVSLYKLMRENKKSKYAGYNSTLNNNNTIRCFTGNVGDYKKITVNGVDLYEGKLKVIKPLPMPEPPSNIDCYYELFEGDITWAEQPKQSIAAQIVWTNPDEKQAVVEEPVTCSKDESKPCCCCNKSE